MNLRRSNCITGTHLMVCILLAGLLLASSAQAFVDRPASIEYSGEGAIFDVKATAAGTLRVGTKAGRVGDRWRVTIAQATGAGAVSAVGSGSATAFSGYISLAVAANVHYVVVVSWERPMPGTFPANVQIRFTGASDAANPPAVQLNGGSLTSILPRPIRYAEPVSSCPGDEASIGCEALVSCEIKPAMDIDIYKVTVPANSDLSINLLGPSYHRWRILAPNGTYVNPLGSSGLGGVTLPAAGTYTIQVYNSQNLTGPYVLSLLGVSTPFRCGPVVTSGGSRVTGKFEPAGDTDSYQLNNVQAGQIYSINITGPSYTRWVIYDPNGDPINPLGCSGRCDLTLPKAGGYTILIYNSMNNTGSYTFSVQKVGG